MIDIKFLRENPDAVKENIKSSFYGMSYEIKIAKMKDIEVFAKQVLRFMRSVIYGGEAHNQAPFSMRRASSSLSFPTLKASIAL